MNLVYLIAVLLGLAVYASTSRLKQTTRVVLALVAFAIPVVFMAAQVFIAINEAPPDAAPIHRADERPPSSERKP